MTPDQRAAFLDSLAAGVDVPRAMRAAGIRERALKAAREADPELDLACLAAERRVLPSGWAAAVAASERATVAEPPAPATDPPAEPGALDLDVITREAAQLAGALPLAFGFLLWVDLACQRAGMPALSPWWQWSLGEAYASGKAWLVFLVGRGGGKSTSLEKAAGADSFFTPRRVPPGQTWTWPFISVGPDDANRRINGIAAVYRAIGLPMVGEESEGKKIKRGDGVNIVRAPRGALELVDARGNPIALASIAGTIGNVSGPSTIGMTIDEAAKLHDRSANANPLTEIIASGAQTSRARPGWRAIVCSSAWGRSGAHWQLVEQGDNDSNHVARIGAAFIDDAKRGFEAVAAWECARKNTRAAATIRAHAASLSPSSPLVPTWVANPTLGNPDALPWDGAALASRKLVEALPEGALDGLTREQFWLRENGSVPLDRDGSFDASAQLVGLADATRKVADDVRQAWADYGRPSDRNAPPPAFGGGWTGGGGTL